MDSLTHPQVLICFYRHIWPIKCVDAVLVLMKRPGHLTGRNWSKRKYRQVNRQGLALIAHFSLCETNERLDPEGTAG